MSFDETSGPQESFERVNNQLLTQVKLELIENYFYLCFVVSNVGLNSDLLDFLIVVFSLSVL